MLLCDCVMNQAPGPAVYGSRTAGMTNVRSHTRDVFEFVFVESVTLGGVGFVISVLCAHLRLHVHLRSCITTTNDQQHPMR
jgi:hypothetical protein